MGYFHDYESLNITFDAPLWQQTPDVDGRIIRLRNGCATWPLSELICPLFALQGLQSEGFNSIDWFKGKITGKSHISWENRWFPVDFPLNQPID